MNRLLVGRVISLGLLMVVVLALSACGGDEKKAKARPLPEDPKALRPGTYRSEEFKPSLSFRVGKGWSSAPLEASDFLQIARGQTAGLGFGNFQEVYKPTKTGGGKYSGCSQGYGWVATAAPLPANLQPRTRQGRRSQGPTVRGGRGGLAQGLQPDMFNDSRHPELRGPLQVKHWRTNFAR
jgi:hypothetical protein